MVKNRRPPNSGKEYMDVLNSNPEVNDRALVPTKAALLDHTLQLSLLLGLFLTRNRPKANKSVQEVAAVLDLFSFGRKQP